ncbi:MAG: Fic family protein [Firmicutes bacterium]|nr:Fic family protein [Bacillota bacterium]
MEPHTAKRSLYSLLAYEKSHGIKNGIYDKVQIDFAYNTTHMEGSLLTLEQTRQVYETNAVADAPARVNDIIETVNHFRCFRYIIGTVDTILSENYIKKLHFMLKNGTLDSDREDAVIGDYKKQNNYAGKIEATKAEDTAAEMAKLISEYNALPKVSIYEMIDFHSAFEKIHPFYDGNGRVGRLIMFKECLCRGIVPFFIDDMYNAFYNRGLLEWQTGGEKGYLLDTCLTMQDNMKKILDTFNIEYDKTEYTSKEILKKHN